MASLVIVLCTQIHLLIACTSHFVLWEKNYIVLALNSKEWAVLLSGDSTRLYSHHSPEEPCDGSIHNIIRTNDD